MAISQEERQLADALLKSGKSNTEMLRIVAKRRMGEGIEKAEPPKTSTVGNLAIGAAKEIGSQFKDLGTSMVQGATNLAIGPANLIPSVRGAVSDATSGLLEKAQGAVGLTDENLTASNTTQMVGKGAVIAGEVLSPFVASRLAGLATRGVAALDAKIASDVKDVAGAPAGVVRGAVEKVGSFFKNPKLALAKQNVTPRLEQSANRMFNDTTKHLEDPIAIYEKDLIQSKKAIGDIYADPAISRVGENIGDEFRFVVDRRKHAGTVMGEELKKVGGIKTNIEGVFQKFETEMLDNGLTYDAQAKKLIASKTSKFTQEDMTLLENYTKELNKLGANPTIAEIDAAISRTSGFVDNLKSAKGITSTTNAERLIKQSQAALRGEFTKNPKLANYAKARKLYSDLSNFIEEGAGFLGKITQSGDFAKDASIAKSSVQSILNGGKKDWLIKLEELTGYSALDDSVIALQAMKDAGDFRGLSLLEKISQGSIPTSPTGISQKVLDFALEKASKVVGGTPEEQTRAFLNALKEAAQSGASR